MHAVSQQPQRWDKAEDKTDLCCITLNTSNDCVWAQIKRGEILKWVHATVIKASLKPLGPAFSHKWRCLSLLLTVRLIICDYLDSLKGLAPPIRHQTPSVSMVTAPGKLFVLRWMTRLSALCVFIHILPRLCVCMCYVLSKAASKVKIWAVRAQKCIQKFWRRHCESLLVM